jgi:hypothetical protein
MQMTDDQFAGVLRKVVTEEVKRQLPFYERQLGEIIVICRELLEEASDATGTTRHCSQSWRSSIAS